MHIRTVFIFSPLWLTLISVCSSFLVFYGPEKCDKIELNRTVFQQALSFSSLPAVCYELSQPCQTDSFPVLLCSFLSLLDCVACIGEVTAVSCRITIFCVWVPCRKKTNKENKKDRIFFFWGEGFIGEVLVCRICPNKPCLFLFLQ